MSSLSTGAVVGASSVFSTSTSTSTTPSATAVSTGVSAFFGFRFWDEDADLASTADDRIHYGYAQVRMVVGQPGVLERYVYESTAGASLTVQTQAVPEPSALAALGLGAIAVLRRRKRA